MPNQNKCDHVVGYQNVKYGAHQVLKVSCVTMGRVHVKFNYCPKCGAKIDWEKIEEMVKE